MTAKFFRSVSLLVLLVWTTSVPAQQDQKSVGYGFVSPNTSENLKLEQAIKGMSSRDAIALRDKAINMSCVVRIRIRAFRALGSWSDGAEHSVMVRFLSDEPTLRYVLSRMGRDAQQKYVIYFHPQPGGSADLYTLRPRAGPRNLVALTTTLERAGIPFRTLVPLNGTTNIYIIDMDRDLRPKILGAARRLRARVTQEPGNAKLFGDDEREKAKTVFEQHIKTYETRNPNLAPTCDAQKRKKQ
ncbi:MAG: hypothetical protein LC794_10665 [Acidobacteria bacterium]|nr:hypothetical protein [Acidobacteriota bacterium]MCA1627129.1 hypothetical protein [Acidobacteriota bacterium]